MYSMAANASRGSEAGLPAHVFQLSCLPRDITTSDAMDLVRIGGANNRKAFRITSRGRIGSFLAVTANPATIIPYQLEHHRQVSRNIPKRLTPRSRIGRYRCPLFLLNAAIPIVPSIRDRISVLTIAVSALGHSIASPGPTEPSFFSLKGSAAWWVL
jgi:hypothetical protein